VKSQKHSKEKPDGVSSLTPLWKKQHKKINKKNLPCLTREKMRVIKGCGFEITGAYPGKGGRGIG